ncbi:MAG: hypothetical protein IT424_01530 [Pirellulales bacterium]|nr:hypothetical protein [Pirellulales bacterium]
MRTPTSWPLLIVLACVHPASAITVASGLIGYWPANGDGRDMSGFGRDLTFFRRLGFGDGVSGQAFSFSANNSQYAARTVDDAAYNFGTADFTLQVWANFNEFGGEHTLFEKFTGAGGPGWTLTQLPGPNLQFFAHDAPILDTSGGPAIADFAGNAWHNILVRRSGNEFSLFVNGELIRANTANPSIDTIEPLRMGNRQGSQQFPMDGRIDEAAIWNRALSDAEVASLYEEFEGTLPDPPVLDGPIVWPVAAGGNGHAYEFVRADGIDWSVARNSAVARVFHGVGGHLATATSAAENQFLQNLILDAHDDLEVSPFVEAWLGGYQSNPSGPADQSWTWVTGEPWNFTNWDSDEPNDAVGGGEQYLGIWGPQGGGPLGLWNDQGGPSDPFASGNIQGYLVEYAIPEPAAVGLGLQLAIVAGVLRRNGAMPKRVFGGFHARRARC